jgi:4-oxalmesaconate hydratase
MNKWEPFEEFIRRLYFDTTVYNTEAMELLLKVAGVDNVMFASEMLGGVTTIDPKTGRYFDDNKPCLDGIAWLTGEDRQKILERNVLAAYPRLGPILSRRSVDTLR